MHQPNRSLTTLAVAAVICVMTALGAAPATAATPWQLQPGPDASALQLDAVSATGPHDAWAVGIRYRSDDPSVRGTAVVEHWDGSGYSDVSGVPAADEFTSVSARSGKDVWIAGFRNRYTGTLAVWHYNGSSWRAITSRGLPRPMSGTLLVTSGRDFLAGRRDVGPAGRPAVLATYHGGRTPHWTGQRHLPGGGFFGGTVRGDHDVWAVGGTSQYTRHGHPLLDHWNGHRWTVTVLSHRAGQLVAAAAHSRRDALAVGPGLALRWNGRSWRAQRIGKNAESSFSAVVTASHHTYWACNGHGILRSFYIHFVNGKPEHFSGAHLEPRDGGFFRRGPQALGMADVPRSRVTLAVGAAEQEDGRPTTSVALREQTSA